MSSRNLLINGFWIGNGEFDQYCSIIVTQSILITDCCLFSLTSWQLFFFFTDFIFNLHLSELNDLQIFNYFFFFFPGKTKNKSSVYFHLLDKFCQVIWQILCLPMNLNSMYIIWQNKYSTKNCSSSGVTKEMKKDV